MNSNQDKRLVVPNDKKSTYYFLAIGSLLILSCAVLFNFVSLYENLIGHYLTNVFKGAILLLIAIFLIGIIYAIYLILSKQHTTAMLDQNGIWVRFFGFIPWDDVIYFNTWIVPGTPLETIAIQVKDPNSLFKQASFNGKVSLFWSKIFNNPHITIANITVPNEVIISFARNYISH
jgi:hypothetical protein